MVVSILERLFQYPRLLGTAFLGFILRGPKLLTINNLKLLTNSKNQCNR